MTKYLLDTNAVSDLLRRKIPDEARDFMAGVINAGPVISVISRIELERNKSLAGDDEILTKDFCNDAEVIELTTEIVDRAIQIRKMKTIKTPDAIIAATAIVEKRKLITRDVSDFAGIKGLSVLHSWEARKAQ